MSHQRIIILLAAFSASVITLGRVFLAPAQGATPPHISEGRVTDAAISSVTSGALSVAGLPPVQEIVSEIIETPFRFTGILARWDDPLTVSEDAPLEIRVVENGAWSDWIPLDPLRDAPTGAVLHGKVSEPRFVDNVERFQYRVVSTMTDASFEAFQNIEFVYINSNTPQRPLGWLQRFLGVARADVRVIPRSEWGANESYRYSGDRELWPPSYAPAEKAIIHHTAGSNGGTDPAAVVRGVYYFHAVVLGWGDIGYNYLVDPAGNVYEGRVGGDGVIAGHTYNDAEGIDYNRGTIGIAVLGNYQGETLAAAAQESVTALLTEKTHLFGIPPAGAGPFRNRVDLPNIVGHGDVDATSCPGTDIAGRLAVIRTETQTRFAALPPLPTAQIAAQQAGPPTVETSADAGTNATVTFTFTNIGNTPWQSYLPSRRVVLKPLQNPSRLAIPSWVGEGVAATTSAANVPIGAQAIFTFAVAAPASELTIDEDFALYGPDGLAVPNTQVRVALQVRNHEYAGLIEPVPVAPAAFLGKEQTVRARVQNLGRATWQSGEVVLNVMDLGGRPSAYRARSWTNEFGRFSVNEVVAPGGTATVPIRFRAPMTPGLYLNVYQLARADGVAFAAADQRSVTRADSPWNAQLVERRYPTAVRSSSGGTLVVRYKNTGITTWTRSTVGLRVYDAGFQPSRFAHPTWPWNTAPFQMREARVRPGGTATFTVRLQSPGQSGVYRQILRLEAKKTQVVIDNAVADFLTRVDQR